MSRAKLPVLRVIDAARTPLGVIDIEHIHVTREKGEQGSPCTAAARRARPESVPPAA